ncbi:hypothetical protein ACJX0J_025158, partial [Zea mays]
LNLDLASKADFWATFSPPFSYYTWKSLHMENGMDGEIQAHLIQEKIVTSLENKKGNKPVAFLSVGFELGLMFLFSLQSTYMTSKIPKQSPNPTLKFQPRVAYEGKIPWLTLEWFQQINITNAHQAQAVLEFIPWAHLGQHINWVVFCANFHNIQSFVFHKNPINQIIWQLYAVISLNVVPSKFQNLSFQIFDDIIRDYLLWRDSDLHKEAWNQHALNIFKILTIKCDQGFHGVSWIIQCEIVQQLMLALPQDEDLPIANAHMNVIMHEAYPCT